MIRLKIEAILIFIVKFVFGLASFGLLVRFIMRLFAASGDSLIVSFVYNSTNPLLYPFRSIFEPYILNNQFVFEFSTLIAIGVYLLLAWLIIQFIEFVDYSTVREV